MKNYYQILGIKENATLTEVKAGYRKLSKKYHPDVNDGNKSYEEIFREIQEAYEVLSDHAKRVAYNQELKYYRFELNTKKGKILQETLEKGRGYHYKAQEELKTYNQDPVVEKWYTRILTNKYMGFVAFGIAAVVLSILLLSKTDTDEGMSPSDSAMVAVKSDSIVVLGISKLEEQKKYWSKFNGSWSGSGTASALSQNFTVKLTADFDNEIFTVEYPDLGFSGNWELMQAGDGTAVFRETIKQGLLNNTQVGTVKVTVSGDNKLEYQYYFPHENHLFAMGFLKRN